MTLHLPNLQRFKVRMSHYNYTFKMAQKNFFKTLTQMSTVVLVLNALSHSIVVFSFCALRHFGCFKQFAHLNFSIPSCCSLINSNFKLTKFLAKQTMARIVHIMFLYTEELAIYIYVCTIKLKVVLKDCIKL